MTSRLYDTFRELLETLPVKAIIRAADAERRMVEDDLEKKRTPVDEESLSVLEFCNFLIDAAHGWRSSLPIWPSEHCAFYRRVVQRLVEAGELPPNIAEQIENTSSLQSRSLVAERCAQ
jgi:hypothetical protein